MQITDMLRPDADFSREIGRIGLELDIASMARRPRDWDRIRRLQDILATISRTAREQEGDTAEDRMLAVTTDFPRSTEDLRDLANRRLRRLADIKADVRLALGARMAWAIAEIVHPRDAEEALRSLRRKGMVRRRGLQRRWVRA